MYFMPINGGGGDGAQVNKKHTVSMEIPRVLIAKRGGKQASEPDGVVIGLYSQGEMALCGRSTMQVVM